MLRAIAGYILGGIINDSPQETLECETREVNDWLVVNMPDKPDENDLDFDSDTESVLDEDDILTCVPMLMTNDELEYDDSLSEDDIPIEEIPREPLIFTPEELIRRTAEIMEEDVKNCEICIRPEEGLYVEDKDLANLGFILENEYMMLTYSRYNPEQIVESYYSKKKRDVIQNIRGKYSRKRGQEKESHQKDKNPDLTCHLIHAPTYLNHRPLTAAAAKTDLLQQIKEIEPSQKAKDIALKKHVTRSQLNRQNKNYIYCSSAKTTKRKDLQRNHSGANNNRKC